MPRFPLVRWIALFWGFSVFFPISWNYLALGGLMVAMVWEGGLRVRLGRLRAQPNWWAAWGYLGWVALVLVAGAHYPETSSNAFHAVRIVLTLFVVLALSRQEAVWALRGFWAGVVAVLVLSALHAVTGLPDSIVWRSIVQYGGNKSLSNAVLMALAFSSVLVLLPRLTGRQRWIAAVIALGAIAVLLSALHSRTAWLVLLLGVAAGMVHTVRSQTHGRRHVWAWGLVLVVMLSAGWLMPGVRDRVAQGATEISHAQAGQKVDQSSSWGIRFRMYTETLGMMRERPLMGWGMGGWSAQWKARVEPALAEANMPHNDFLWMGAQAGIPGTLLLFWLIAAGLPQAWRNLNVSGRMGVIALLTELAAVMSNSALRDAQIGLSLWFVVLVYQRLSTEPESVWGAAFPGGQLNDTAPAP
jgi:O-antigen ligase